MATTSSSSSESYTQAQRAFRFDSPLGRDALLLTSFGVTEEISRPYALQVELLSEKPDLDPKKLVGQPVSLAVELIGGGTRHFHGICSRVSQGGRQELLTEYRVEVVPKLWLFSHMRDNRIFQNLTVPEIVQQVLKGIDLKLQLLKSYPKREYCVQYRETNLDFVSRLLEDEGIFYFFEHTAEKHLMVIADDPSAIKATPDLRSVRIDTEVGDGYEENVIFRIEREHAVRSGKTTIRDYNFEKPTARLQTEMPGEDPFKLELYDYPGGFAAPEEGERIARIRLEEQEALLQTVACASNVRHLRAGFKVEITDHYRKDVNGSYVITSVQHSGSLENVRAEGQGVRYQNQFVAIPAKVPFRPARVTPRPMMSGTQTAVVVGKGGEEIWVDKYGRVKIQFHWDRQGKKDENSSCWVRVASTWAGKQWGFIQIPRIGQEVIVDFLEGDPDQPIIVASVYNADQMPPWALPANQTQSGVQSRSTKGGAADNANVFRFEDKKGSEEVYLHAEKNKREVVENDNSEDTGHDERISVGNDQTITIGKDRKESVGEDESITIGKDRRESVGGDETVNIGKNRTHSIATNDALNVGGKHAVQVGKDQDVQVAGNRTTKVAKEDKLDVGKKLFVNAADEIVLKTGDASLTMKKDGTITLKGKDIKIEGSGKVNVKASSDVVIKGSKVTAN
jgi:type VI secretion system secreted protein VgrG